MTENVFLKLLKQKQVLLTDGAMGTNLFAQGLAAGEAPERWNLEAPDKIQGLHTAFIEAGSDLILTNSFGGTRERLKLHGLDDRVKEINAAAAHLAKAAANQAARPVAIAGCIGPTGALLTPLGDMSYQACVDAFYEQMQGLAAGGADLFWIETIAAADELRAAVEAAQSFNLPIVATMSFDSAGSTMMGLSPQAYARQSLDLGLDGFGANCGVGPADMLGTLLAFAQVESAAGTPKIVKANCGIPTYVKGRIEYSGTKTIMAHYAKLARANGARLIGGCCGTTPSHIKAMANALHIQDENPTPSLASIESLLGPMSDGAKALASGSEKKASPRRSRRQKSS